MVDQVWELKYIFDCDSYDEAKNQSQQVIMLIDI